MRKPVESARQNGILGLAHGLGRAFLGFIVQPVSGALDFFSLTVDGIGASCSKCFEVFNNKTAFHRIRNPRAVHSDGIVREYCEREAIGQVCELIASPQALNHLKCFFLSFFFWEEEKWGIHFLFVPIKFECIVYIATMGGSYTCNVMIPLHGKMSISSH